MRVFVKDGPPMVSPLKLNGAIETIQLTIAITSQRTGRSEYHSPLVVVVVESDGAFIWSVYFHPHKVSHIEALAG